MSNMGSATFLEGEEREWDKTILWRVNCWGISKLTKDFMSLILRSLMKAARETDKLLSKEQQYTDSWLFTSEKQEREDSEMLFSMC